MMNLKHWIFALVLTMTFTACIRDEALNTEADIESVMLEGNVLNRDAVFGDALSDGTYPITLYVKKGVDVTRLAPQLTWTEGATVVRASGTVLDFSQPQYYTVTSEDGDWQRKYRIEVVRTTMLGAHYSFENIRKGGNGKYHVFFEKDVTGAQTFEWASGNPGYAISDNTIKNPELFPTFQSDEGKQGKCLKLVTRKTGSLGASVNMPIATGNLFIGTFNVLNALQNALKATQFGIQFEHVPTYVKGWYQYKAGEMFYELDKSAPDKMRPVPDRKDVFNIYAVFYESTDQRPLLDGTDILAEDNPQIVAVAQIDNARETKKWTEFHIPFVMRKGKTIDKDKLAAGKYNLTIVFASSKRGDYFEGAPGSTLLIDEVELGYKDAE